MRYKNILYLGLSIYEIKAEVIPNKEVIFMIDGKSMSEKEVLEPCSNLNYIYYLNWLDMTTFINKKSLVACIWYFNNLLRNKQKNTTFGEDMNIALLANHIKEKNNTMIMLIFLITFLYKQITNKDKNHKSDDYRVIIHDACHLDANFLKLEWSYIKECFIHLTQIKINLSEEEKKMQKKKLKELYFDIITLLTTSLLYIIQALIRYIYSLDPQVKATILKENYLIIDKEKFDILEILHILSMLVTQDFQEGNINNFIKYVQEQQNFLFILLKMGRNL